MTQPQSSRKSKTLFGAWFVLTASLFLAFKTDTNAQSASSDNPTVKLFRSQCSACHGIDGRGQTTAGKRLKVKDWTDGKTLPTLSDEQIRSIIREGRKDEDGKQQMQPYKKLTDEQVTALIGHIRQFAKKTGD